MTSTCPRARKFERHEAFDPLGSEHCEQKCSTRQPSVMIPHCPASGWHFFRKQEELLLLSKRMKQKIARVSKLGQKYESAPLQRRKDRHRVIKYSCSSGSKIIIIMIIAIIRSIWVVTLWSILKKERNSGTLEGQWCLVILFPS